MTNVSRALARKRENEAKLESTRQYVENNFKLKLQTHWENKHCERSVEKCKRKTDVEELSAPSLAQKRRENLKELYEEEMNRWRLAIIESQSESMEVRMEKIRKKAYQLKDARETEREAYVADCYNRQWRDACDEARTLDSKVRIKQLMFDREQQLSSKEKSQNKDEENPELTSLPLWADKEKEIRHRLEKNASLRKALDEQMSFIANKKSIQERMRSEEEHNLMKQWHNDIEREKQKENERRRRAKLNGEDAMNINRERLKAKQIEREKEKVNDISLLKYALQKEAEDIQREVDKREQAQEETREYTKYLREQMVRESIDSGEQDVIRAKAMRDICNKRDRELKAQIDARSQLMKEVQEGRIRQIEEKEKQTKFLKEMELEELAARSKESEKEEEVQRLRNEEKKKQMYEGADFIKKQIENKKLLKQKEAQEKYLLAKQMQYSEKRQREKISRLSMLS